MSYTLDGWLSKCWVCDRWMPETLLNDRYECEGCDNGDRTVAS